jgi:hypothetical protein
MERDMPVHEKVSTVHLTKLAARVPDRSVGKTSLAVTLILPPLTDDAFYKYVDIFRSTLARYGFNEDRVGWTWIKDSDEPWFRFWSDRPVPDFIMTELLESHPEIRELRLQVTMRLHRHRHSRTQRRKA